MVRSRPRIILSSAITLDGKLATRTGDSKLSTKRDKIRVYKLRSKVDAIIIGKNTAKIDDPLLSTHNIKGKNPIRVILDSNGTLDTNSRIIKTCSKISTIIVVSKKAKENNKQIVLAKSNKNIHPVIGIWNINLLESLENNLLNGERKIIFWAKKHELDFEEFFEENYDPFFNINYKEDLNKAKEIEIKFRNE